MLLKLMVGKWGIGGEVCFGYDDNFLLLFW